MDIWMIDKTKHCSQSQRCIFLCLLDEENKYLKCGSRPAAVLCSFHGMMGFCISHAWAASHAPWPWEACCPSVSHGQQLQWRAAGSQACFLGSYWKGRSKSVVGGWKITLSHLWQPSPSSVWVDEHSGIIAWLTAESGTELCVWSCLWLPKGPWIWFLFCFVQGHWWISWLRCASCPQSLGSGTEGHQGWWLALPWWAAGPLLLPETGCPKILHTSVRAFLRNQVLETAVFDLPACLSKLLALQGK